MPPNRLQFWLLASLLSICCTFSPEGALAQSEDEAPEVTRILFVFDASNSMNAFWGRRRKWDVARDMLIASVDSLYGIEGLEVGLRVYGHGTKHVPGQQDCDDTELVVPISKGGNLLIPQELKKLRAQGTTPIARSLLLSAEDFAAEEGQSRNVILLITDGIEACDEDPCAVSRALQAQGIMIKPFIIGIGLEEKYRETFQCVGRYFDAANPETFEEVLDIVIDQAIHRTTVQLDLLDAEGQASTTDLPFEIIEQAQTLPILQGIHTLNADGHPDTLVLNPVPRYDVVVHSIPPVRLESVTLKPRQHNHLTLNVPTGILDLTPSRPRSDLMGIPVRVISRAEGSCQTIHTQAIGSQQRYLAGTYDLEFATTPITRVEGVNIRDKSTVPVTLSEPGSLNIRAGTSGHGGIFLDTDNGRQLAVQFNGDNPTGRYALQPGSYVVMFRAKHADRTDLSLTKTVDIRSGGSHTLDF